MIHVEFTDPGGNRRILGEQFARVEREFHSRHFEESNRGVSVAFVHREREAVSIELNGLVEV
nr:hypothetical protein [Haladaptatus pallidirubidus]